MTPRNMLGKLALWAIHGAETNRERFQREKKEEQNQEASKRLHAKRQAFEKQMEKQEAAQQIDGLNTWLSKRGFPPVVWQTASSFEDIEVLSKSDDVTPPYPLAES